MDTVCQGFFRQCKSGSMKYKGYEAIVEFDDEDRLFIGRVMNTPETAITPDQYYYWQPTREDLVGVVSSNVGLVYHSCIYTLVDCLTICIYIVNFMYVHCIIDCSVSCAWSVNLIYVRQGTE